MTLYSTSITARGLVLDLLESYGNAARGRYVSHVLQNYGRMRVPDDDDEKDGDVGTLRMRLDEGARAKLETIPGGERSRYVSALVRQAFEDAKAAVIELGKLGIDRGEIKRGWRVLADLNPKRDDAISPALMYGAAERRLDRETALVSLNADVVRWFGTLMKSVPPIDGALDHVIESLFKGE